jgi:hypothetical protein
MQESPSGASREDQEGAVARLHDLIRAISIVASILKQAANCMWHHVFAVMIFAVERNGFVRFPSSWAEP